MDNDANVDLMCRSINPDDWQARRGPEVRRGTFIECLAWLNEGKPMTEDEVKEWKRRLGVPNGH